MIEADKTDIRHPPLRLCKQRGDDGTTLELHTSSQVLRGTKHPLNSVGDFGGGPVTEHRPTNNVFDWKRTPVKQGRNMSRKIPPT